MKGSVERWAMRPPANKSEPAERPFQASDTVKCRSCGLERDQQEKHRLPGFDGLCFPGRCVVNGTVWLTMPDGKPLSFVTDVEQDLADSLHRADMGHLSPYPPRKEKR